MMECSRAEYYFVYCLHHGNIHFLLAVLFFTRLHSLFCISLTDVGIKFAGNSQNKKHSEITLDVAE
jgi:hypothetical protein